MRTAPALSACVLLLGAPAGASDLYSGSSWTALSADRRAAEAGDLLTVVIFQSAEASNSAQNSSRRRTDVGGGINAGPIEESGKIEFGGGYSGRGEVRRNERLVAQITVAVEEVLPNGDLRIAGEQWMRINGETSKIGVRGRVRTADITSANTVLSGRIADAQINYDGRGFVSRSARPGLINRLFNFLGLG